MRSGWREGGGGGVIEVAIQAESKGFLAPQLRGSGVGRAYGLVGVNNEWQAWTMSWLLAKGYGLSQVHSSYPPQP